ncbi:MAG: M15 family metallopeptidase [Ferruginibacter sp.]
MTKIANSFYIYGISILFFLTQSLGVKAQASVLNQYGLDIILTKKEYHNSIKNKPGNKMIDLKKTINGIAFDLRYATNNNFMGVKLYPTITTTYLRNNAALALDSIQSELYQKGLGIKIFDAYRPYSITEKMWELVKDDRYAANPKYGSGHNRGIAVDVTIIDLKTKMPLDMGTDFDNFSDTAHHSFKNLSTEILQNRLLLKTVMEKYGFKALETEWWHYALPNAKDYELMNLGFSDLKKITR